VCVCVCVCVCVTCNTSDTNAQFSFALNTFSVLAREFPALMEYFAHTATANDTFFGATSGCGYVAPPPTVCTQRMQHMLPTQFLERRMRFDHRVSRSFFFVCTIKLARNVHTRLCLLQTRTTPGMRIRRRCQLARFYATRNKRRSWRRSTLLHQRTTPHRTGPSTFGTGKCPRASQDRGVK
jgi:hypothetical protein